MQKKKGDGAVTVCVSIPKYHPKAHNGGGGFLYEMRLFAKDQEEDAGQAAVEVNRRLVGDPCRLELLLLCWISGYGSSLGRLRPLHTYIHIHNSLDEWAGTTSSTPSGSFPVHFLTKVLIGGHMQASMGLVNRGEGEGGTL